VSSAYAEIQRRIEYLAPLYAYLHAHFLIPGRLVAAASAEVGSPISSVVLSQMKRGERVIPSWLVAVCCQTLGRPVAEVMGAEWVRRFGEDGRGGAENAPVGEPRVYARPADRRIAGAAAAAGAASVASVVAEADRVDAA
jgi:hypothetical protein